MIRHTSTSVVLIGLRDPLAGILDTWVRTHLAEPLDVTSVHTVPEALAYLRSHRIDLVLADETAARHELRTIHTVSPDTAIIGVVMKPEEISPQQPVAPIDYTKDLQCPLLGFFGVEDTRPSPADAAKTEEALKKHGKTYEFHHYENCGHAFFAVDRPQYRVHAAVDGWKKVFGWFGKYLR